MTLPCERNIEISELVREASLLHTEGYRMVTATCVNAPDGFELLYHFDLDYDLLTFRVSAPFGTKVPSLTGVYPAAMLIENEIADLFGITFMGLHPDFKKLLLLAQDAPCAPQAARNEEKKGQA